MSNGNAIYSLGATAYHLLTGKRPSERAEETVPVSKAGRFGEGVVFIIERCMRVSPAERFACASALREAVRDIHKFDARFKALRAKQIAAAVILPVVFILCAASALFGKSVMAREKERRYYSYVQEIENSENPQEAYDEALLTFYGRPDPYKAMAKRLWNDGNIDKCKEYIKQNIANIAEFKNIPEAQKDFGDIYYILGNCYYYGSGDIDYNAAYGCFDTAAQFVTDNPAYYRDLAVCSARINDTEKAAALYNENVKPGEEDAQMQELELLMRQLRANRWLD